MKLGPSVVISLISNILMIFCDDVQYLQYWRSSMIVIFFQYRDLKKVKLHKNFTNFNKITADPIFLSTLKKDLFLLDTMYRFRDNFKEYYFCIGL